MPSFQHLSRVIIRCHAERDIVIPFVSVRLSICDCGAQCKSGITNTQAYLDGQVERNKVVAEAIAADDVETTCAESFDRCARTAAVLTLVIQVVIQVTYHVPASIRTNTVV